MSKWVNIAAMLVVMGPANGSAQRVEPYEAFRRMQDLRDKAAFGAAASDDEVSVARVRFVASVKAAEVDWKDQRNRNALVMFLLTGGEAWEVADVATMVSKSGKDSDLLRKSFAFANSNRDAKPDEFASINLKVVPPEAAGVVALAQARMLAAYDRSRAIEKLGVAAILAPGGLVEEAALRQQVFLLDRKADIWRVNRIAHRYLGRFSRSRYADNFLQAFRKLVEEIWTDREASSKRELIETLDGLPRLVRSDVLFSLARSALLRGDSEGALTATKVVCGAKPDDEPSRERCRLYRWLASLFGSVDSKRSVPDVPDAELVELSDEDRLLLACAQRLDEIAETVEPSGAKTSAAPPELDENFAEAKAIRGQLSEADKLIAMAP